MQILIVVTVSARPKVPFKPAILLTEVDGELLFGEQLCGKPATDVYWADFKHVRHAKADAEICLRLGRRKVRNLVEYREERQSARERRRPGIFVGDNGEGDVEAAIELLRRNCIEHALIRKLTAGDAALFVHQPPTVVAAPGVTYFEDFAEASAKAF